MRFVSRLSLLLAATATLWGPAPTGAQSATNVVVAFLTANPTPLNPGFAGFTTELLGTGVEYCDTNMQAMAANLSPGWVLFPAGTTGDAFNWATGMTETNWVNHIALKTPPGDTTSNLCAVTIGALMGKGGAWFTNFAAMAANLGGARIIVCVNAFTDTPESAGAFAAFALSNHISVAAWELCNEPYLFQGDTNFFTNGTDYANQMLPYRNAIKAADPNAVVAVFFTDPSHPAGNWDKDLAACTNQYWDAIVYHHYPDLRIPVPFADLMAMDNGVLLSNTTLYVTNTLIPMSGPNVAFLITEFDPTLGNGDGTQNPPTSSLYGGIYASEYVMRLSTCPRMAFAGSYQMVNGSGVDTTNLYWYAVTKAAGNGAVTNTIGLPFGYFLSAQGAAEAVAYWALNRSTAVYATSVGTNGSAVPMDTNGLTAMPALYAQAYRGGNGKNYVLLTNKGSNSVPVQITQDGVAVTNQLLETFVTGSDPSVVNASAQDSPVTLQCQIAANPLTIPPYSVVRLEWTVFTVPRPVLGIAPASGGHLLSWLSVTNVIYAVQRATNPLASWTTMGKMTATQTNLSFTALESDSPRFFRLLVP